MNEIYVIGTFNEYGGSNELATTDHTKAMEKVEELKEEVLSWYDDDEELVEQTDSGAKGNAIVWSINGYNETGVFLETYKN